MMWQQSRLKGGGNITGLLQDPREPDILYARSDVAGVFKSLDGGHNWQACNYGMTDCHHHDVQSFALSPHNPSILFRGSGSVRGGTFFGTIHKSINGGAFWFPVCSAVDFYGNGETRAYGEVIQVDPFDPLCVVAGGYSAGIWISTNGGTTWAYAGLKHERIACVAFHPARKDTLYVGTIGSFDRDPQFVAEQHDYVRPNPARLYRSVDRGQTWEMLCEGMDFGELAFDPTAPDTIHAACLHAGVMKSTDGGHTWRNPATGLSKYLFGTLTIDPHDPARLYAAAATFPNFDPDVPPIGIYASHDSGESWHLVKWHTAADLRNYPDYMSLEAAGWVISKIRVDAHDSRKLYISNWYGVATSDDAGLTWDAHQFSGMENVCIENVTTHPTQPETVYLVIADHNPFVSTDGGRSFHDTPRIEVTPPYPNSTALVVSRWHPDLMLYGIKGTDGGCLVRAGADGRDPCLVWRSQPSVYTQPSRLALQSRAADVTVQALAEDPFRPGRFYAFMDGFLSRGAGVYTSVDWGETWQRLPLRLPDFIQHLPHERQWIESELLSVVAAQTKNVCGTNQLLCLDPHREGTLYLGEWTEGLFRSTDAGQTWAQIGSMLPFKRDRASALNGIWANACQPGVLYAGFIREGLWRSTDFGETWEKRFPVSDHPFNATSVAVDKVSGRRIVVVSEPLYWSPCESAVWLSEDGGTTWRDLYDKRLGAIRWKGVAFSADGQTIHAGSCGNSAFYLRLGESE